MNVLYSLLLTFMAWNIAWGMEPDLAGQAGHHFHPRSPVQASLYRADKNVNEAWQAFHQAALGGTLASPAIQTKIEQALHESRRLLSNARKAARGNDPRAVSALTTRIEELSTHVKEQSQRRKP